MENEAALPVPSAEPEVVEPARVVTTPPLMCVLVFVVVLDVLDDELLVGDLQATMPPTTNAKIPIMMRPAADRLVKKGIVNLLGQKPCGDHKPRTIHPEIDSTAMG
jgi:hypothetical protein